MEGVATRMEGVATRARIQWLKEGEKPSSFFCSFEKCIKLKDGECITDQKKILTRVRKFYLDLFSQKQGSQDIQHNEFLKNLNT